jgi:hypothetical protein
LRKKNRSAEKKICPPSENTTAATAPAKILCELNPAEILSVN